MAKRKQTFERAARRRKAARRAKAAKNAEQGSAQQSVEPKPKPAAKKTKPATS